ncbi:MAG: NlpC/P60 family protein [Rubrobacteraceae bacterium]
MTKTVYSWFKVTSPGGGIVRRLFGVYATAFITFGAVLGASLVMAPAAHAGTYYQVVDNSNSSRFQASGRWIVSSFHSNTDYGKNYRVLKKPLSVSDNARFKIRTPAKGSYRVLARWPSDSGYNSRARFWVKTSGGWKSKTVNQRTNGGKWVLLGTYTLAAGDSYRVQVSSRSSGRGYIIADAVKVVRVTSGTTTSSGPTGLKVVREAKTWLGVPYKYGGASRNGVDCSGLTMMVYKKFGKYLPHNAAEQFKYGTRVSTPAPGNLVFGRYDGTGPGIQHVGIITGSNQMIHAPQPGTVVRYATFKNSYYNIAGVRRYVPNR